MQEAIGEGRYSTGPLIIGGPGGAAPDWPGVFIRGDEALAFAREIRWALREGIDLGEIQLDMLLKVLESCKVDADGGAS